MPNIKWRVSNGEPGFTLIEILVAIALVAILSAVLASVVTYTSRSAAIERTRSDLIVENRRLLDDTMRMVKAANTVLRSATVLGSLYTTDAQTLVLQVPAVDSAQSIVPNATDLIVFRLNGVRYELRQEGATGSIRPNTANRAYSKRVNNLAFTYYDVNGNVLDANFQNAYMVAVFSTLSATVRSQTIISSLTEKATLRNK